VAAMNCPSRSVDPTYAIDRVAAYTLFDDASTRDYHVKTQEGAMDQKFNAPGALGPGLLSEDELLLGCEGQQLQTKLNMDEAQGASTSDLMFEVIMLLCEAFDSKVGDVYVAGPSCGAVVRKPPLWMKPGYVGEVGLEGLRNPSCSTGDDLIRGGPRAQTTSCRVDIRKQAGPRIGRGKGRH
jgi:acylpyruvate hydrolase